MRAQAVQRKVGLLGSACLLFATQMLFFILSLMMPTVFAAAPEMIKGNPRLTSLQSEIWPEFDRPAALVILRGEIAADVALPATISLRIAASSGGPAAVAYSSAAGGNLLNLKHERKDAGNFIVVKFDSPARFFHVEYYEPLNTAVSNRSYTYVWPGDVAVERMSVIVQEPASASNFSVQPALSASAAGQDGLRYRSADLGPYPSGKRLEVKLAYTKTDSRTSNEIIKPAAATAGPSSLPAAGAASSPLTASGPDKVELVMWLLGIVAALGLFIWAALTWWYGRDKPVTSQQKPVGFCTKCGAPLAPGARFCSKCGTPRT